MIAASGNKDSDAFPKAAFISRNLAPDEVVDRQGKLLNTRMRVHVCIFC